MLPFQLNIDVCGVLDHAVDAINRLINYYQAKKQRRLRIYQIFQDLVRFIPDHNVLVTKNTPGHEIDTRFLLGGIEIRQRT